MRPDREFLIDKNNLKTTTMNDSHKGPCVSVQNSVKSDINYDRVNICDVSVSVIVPRVFSSFPQYLTQNI